MQETPYVAKNQTLKEIVLTAQKGKRRVIEKASIFTENI